MTSDLLVKWVMAGAIMALAVIGVIIVYIYAIRLIHRLIDPWVDRLFDRLRR